MNYFKKNKKFWKAAAIRAARTFFEVFAASIASAKIMSEVDWPLVLSASFLATILSLALALRGLPVVEDDV